MDAETTARLLALNQLFYQTFSVQFSSTRQRLQPGVERILDRLETRESSADAGLRPAGTGLQLLELGCGNGALARQLAARDYTVGYVGLDLTFSLLQIAKTSLAGKSGFHFFQRDLAAPDWNRDLPYPEFDIILAFAVLHHLPGEALRRAVLGKVHSLLPPGGCFIHSEWQLFNSPRLRSRIQPWSAIGLPEELTDPGDCLVDWRRGGTGLRYVHVFTPSELTQLADDSGFNVLETFHSDGEGGRLGIYQIWSVV